MKYTNKHDKRLDIMNYCTDKVIIVKNDKKNANNPCVLIGFPFLKSINTTPVMAPVSPRY